MDERLALSGAEALRKAVLAGRWREARRGLDAAVRKAPRDHRFRLMRSGVRLMSGDAAGGWDDLRKAFALAPSLLASYAEARTEAVPASLWSEDLIPTKDLLQRITVNGGRWTGLKTWRGLLRRRVGDYAGAALDLRGARGRDALAWRGEARLQLGDDRGFEDLARAARGSNVAWHHAWLGRALVHSRRDRAALKAFDRAIRLEPDNGWHVAWRAEAKRVLGVRKGMLADFDRALAFDPGYEYQGWVRTWRAAALIKEGKAAEALAEFDRALEKLPGYAPALSGRAQALRALGRREEWLVALEVAARRDRRQLAGLFNRPAEELTSLRADTRALVRRRPSDATARRWSGLFAALSGRSREAHEGYARALALRPRDAWARAWRGELLLREGNAPAARAELTRALAADAGDALALAWRARAWVREGRGAEARRDLDRAIVLDPRFAWMFTERGRLRLVEGDARGGAEDLERALLLDRGDPDVYVDLSVARLRLGERKAGAAALARANFLDAARTQRRLDLWKSATIS